MASSTSLCTPCPMEQACKDEKRKCDCIHLPGNRWKHRACELSLVRWGALQLLTCTACWCSSGATCHMCGCWKKHLIYLQNYKMVLPVQVVNKTVLPFQCNPALIREEISLQKRSVKVNISHKKKIFFLFVSREFLAQEENLENVLNNAFLEINNAYERHAHLSADGR